MSEFAIEELGTIVKIVVLPLALAMVCSFCVDARQTSADAAGTRRVAATTSRVSIPCRRLAHIAGYDRAQAIAAIAGPEHDVSLEALAHNGCFGRVLGSLRTVGAAVDFSERHSDFIALRVSSRRLPEVLEIRGVDEIGDIVTQAFVNKNAAPYVPQATRTPGPVPSYHVSWPQVATKDIPGDPFFPADEIALTSWWKKFPDADGRGVRVGLLDTGLDLLHPALHYARDAEGHIVPKLAGIIATTRSDRDNEWVETYPVELSANGIFKAAGERWRAPPGRYYRFGILRWWSNNPANMQARDRQYAIQLAVGVLWNTTTNIVRVDTNGNHNFTDDLALPDYRIARKIGWFGKLDSKGDNRIAFAIHIDHNRNAIFVDMGDGDHGTIVAGTLAANRLSGGLFDGAAPMAQIVDVRLSSGTISPYVAAFADQRIDVISCSCRVGSPKPGEVFQQAALERLMRAFPTKPLICYCAVSGAISVYDYQSSEDLRKNRRASGPYGEEVHGGTWTQWGYLQNLAGTENFLLAPSASLTTQSRYLPFMYSNGGNRQRWALGKGYEHALGPPAPAGYAIGSNMSPTITVVAGVVADLIGLARHEGVRYDAFRIRNALFTGSRIVPGFSALQQENGLLNALGAWRQLVAMSHVDDPANSLLTRFDVFAASQRPIDGFFESFTHSGSAQIRSLWIVRRGGYRGAQSYRLAIRADGTAEPSVFTLVQKMVAFRRDQPVRIRFRIDLRPGEHLSYLELIDKASATIMQTVPLHIIVPDTLHSEGSGVMAFHTEIAPRRSDFRYFAFPDDVQAIHIRVQKPFGGLSGMPCVPGYTSSAIEDVSVGESDGSGMLLSWCSSGIGAHALDIAHHVGPLWTVEAMLPPSPGLIDLFWENRGEPEYETPYEPPASTLPEAATATFDMYRVVARRDGDKLYFTNTLAPFDGSIEFFSGTQTLQESVSADRYGFARLDLQVPADATELHMTVQAQSLRDNQALEAYLLKCSQDACTVAARSHFIHGVANLTLSSTLACTYYSTFNMICTTSTDRRLIDVKESAVLAVLSRPQPGRHAMYTITERTVLPISEGSASAFTQRQHSETWSMEMPVLPSDGGQLYWALRLAPEQDSDAKNGYLTQLKSVP